MLYETNLFQIVLLQKRGGGPASSPLGYIEKKENQILQGLIFAEAANKSIRS